MDLLTYTLVGMPIFLSLFVIMTRFNEDVTLSKFFGMLMVACVPIMREFVFVFLFFYIIETDKIIFKKFDRRNK